MIAVDVRRTGSRPSPPDLLPPLRGGGGEGWWRRVPLVGSGLLVVALWATLAACGGDEPAEEREIAIHYSKFEPTTVTVLAGVPVTITLVNGDPIEHEWMVGDEAMHQRHRTGTEPYHDEIPTEVSLRAYETRETTIQFDEPGEYKFICHLPGHEAYGMVGVLRVVDPSDLPQGS